MPPDTTPARPPRAQVFVLANHKGGCGKTTSTANLGAALAELGARVLLIDADPQANLSEAFGATDPQTATLEQLLADPDLPCVATQPDITTTNGRAPDLIPCTEQLEATVSTFAHHEAFALTLNDLVSSVAPAYDAILIDTPPGLGALSSMAMLAADWVIAPARPADFDVGGAVKLADLIATDLRELNPGLRLLGVLVTQVDRRWTITAETRQALDEAGVRRLRHEIPFAVRVGAAPRHGAPTVAIEPDGRVACAYRAVARDLLTIIDPSQP